MKWIVPALMGVVLAAGVASAQPEGGPGKEGKPPSFKDMDQNGDGSVSLGEFTEAHTEMLQKRFRNIDTNNDGSLSQGELDEARQRMKERHGKRDD